jgi:hypothetical protein
LGTARPTCGRLLRIEMIDRFYAAPLQGEMNVAML